MKKYLVAFTALALTSLVASAADIDGKWTRENPGRGGGAPTTQTLMLKSSGATLTGSLDNGRGMPTDISDGKITGNMVTFKVVRDLGDKGKQETTYTGTVSATELKLTASGGFGGGGGGGKGGGGGGGGKGGGGGAPAEQVWTKAK
jgi:uncharacterized membrane protein YgcG